MTHLKFLKQTVERDIVDFIKGHLSCLKQK